MRSIIIKSLQRIVAKLQNKNRFKHFDAFRAHDNLQKAQLLEIQQERLKSLVTHAGKTVPYYNEIFSKNKVNLSSPDIFEELKKIPITDKSILSNRFDDFISSDFREKPYRIVYTGGSTGNPTKIMNFKEDEERLIGIFYRNHAWTGFNPWNKSLWIWTTDPERKGKGISDKISFFLSGILLNRKYIHSFDISDTQLKKWISIIEKGNFESLYCHAGSTRYFVERLDKWGVKIDTRLKSIYFSAGELDNREKMEQIFLAPVYNQYGLTEIPAVAEECKNKNMHIAVDSVYLELIPVKGMNYGEIVLTSLERYGFPLIRYKTGDIALLKEERDCDCGLGYPVLDLLPTRTFGALINKNGDLVTPLIASKLSKILMRDKIRQFQLVQNRKQELVLKIVKDDRKISDLTKSKLKELIDRELNIDASIRYEFVAEIPRTKDGKYWIIKNQIINS